MKVVVSPGLELLFGLLASGCYNEKSQRYYGTKLVRQPEGPYGESMQRFFAPHLTHLVFEQLSTMMDFGFFFSRPVELMLAVSEPPELVWRETPSAVLLKYSGGMAELEKLLVLLRDFANQSKYMRFFDQVKEFYTEDLRAVQAHVQKYPFVELLESFFGEKQDDYAYVISKLPVGNFGIHFSEPEGKLRCYSVFNVVPAQVGQSPFGALNLNTTFHEFSHPLVNPLTESNPVLVDQYAPAYAKLLPHKLPGIGSGYGDWPDCMNEHIVRSIACFLSGVCEGGVATELWREKELARGYCYLPAMLESLAFYQQNRAQYPTFASYYPTLLQVFAE